MERIWNSNNSSTDKNVRFFIKIDAVQPSGSFKIRGVGHLCQDLVLRQKFKKLVCASGGNAGLATVYAARQLNVPCVIVLPHSTPPIVKERMYELYPGGVEVVLHGKVWDEANFFVKR